MEYEYEYEYEYRWKQKATRGGEVAPETIGAKCGASRTRSSGDRKTGERNRRKETSGEQTRREAVERERRRGALKAEYTSSSSAAPAARALPESPRRTRSSGLRIENISQLAESLRVLY